MKKFYLMVLLAGFFLFQTMVFADEDVRSQKAVATMDEIVVTGSRQEQTRADNSKNSSPDNSDHCRGYQNKRCPISA